MQKLIRGGTALVFALIALWEVVERLWPDILPRPGWNPPSKAALWTILIGRGIWEVAFLCTVLLLPIALYRQFRASPGSQERRQAWPDAAWVAVLYLCVVVWLRVGSVGQR
jgi:hypothetical protein